MPNPIFQRELVTALRAPRSAWTLAITIGLLTAITLALWPAGGLYSLGEQASHTLLSSVSLGGLLLALLIAPAFTATSLTAEKENASYDLLTHTLLRPWQIAWGKIVSAQLYLLLLVLAIAPILAATLFLGGTGARQLVLVFAVITLAAVSTGLLGFAVSAWSRESFTALVITYSGTLIWCVLPLLPVLLLRGLTLLVPMLGAITYSSPIATMLGILEPDLFVHMQLPVRPSAAIPIYFVTCGILGLACWMAGTLRILMPHLLSRERKSGGVTNLPRPEFPFVLIDPRRRKRLIGDWSNVVLAKELRSKTFGQAPWMIRGMYATFTVSLIFVWLMVKEGGAQQSAGAVLHLDVLKLAMIAFQVLVVILLTPALLAGSVTQETEQRQFELLRQTLLSPHGILIGKTVSAWLLVVLLLIASIPMWWMMLYLESYQWIGTLISMAVVVCTLFLASAVSLAATTVARTTAVAAAIAFAVLAVLSFGTLAPLLMGNRLPPLWRNELLSWNPFASGLQAVSIDFLKGEAMLWKRYVVHALGASAACFFIAWFFLWKKLRSE